MAVALVMGCGLAMMIMARSLIFSLQTTRQEYYEANHFAEAFAHLKRAPNSLKERISVIPGVAIVQPGISVQVTLDLPDLKEPASGMVRSLPDFGTAELNRLFLRAGRWLAGGNAREVLVGEAFADANQLRPGETLTVDLGAPKTVRAVQVNFADYKSGRFADAPDIYTEFELQSSLDGQSWQPLARTEPPRRDRPNAYFELPQPVRARFIRYVHGHVGAANLAISDIRVFGNADGREPQAVYRVTAVRHPDQRDATISWPAIAGAIGYNIRFGTRPDRLTQTYQLWADQLPQCEGCNVGVVEKDLRSLNAGVGYWVAVEAFNESGVSKLSRIVPIR